MGLNDSVIWMNLKLLGCLLHVLWCVSVVALQRHLQASFFITSHQYRLFRVGQTNFLFGDKTLLKQIVVTSIDWLSARWSLTLLLRLPVTPPTLAFLLCLDQTLTRCIVVNP